MDNQRTYKIIGAAMEVHKELRVWERENRIEHRGKRK
jgi:hypothetical protein